MESTRRRKTGPNRAVTIGGAGRRDRHHFRAECGEAVALVLLRGIGAAIVAGLRHEDEIVEADDEVRVPYRRLQGAAERGLAGARRPVDQEDVRPAHP
jgi:hypothetical protein